MEKHFGIITLVVAMAATFCSEANAICIRCRRAVCACKVVKPYVAPYVAPVVYKQPEVFLVNNVYPPSIGAYAQQGNSIYGYQAAAQSYFVNPAEVIRQAAELSKAATATASIGISGYGSIAQTQLALQAGITEPLARGHAAAQVLTAAGFTTPSQQSTSLALRVYQDSGGNWKVDTANAAEVNARVEANIPAAPPASNSIIASKCGRCHGLTLTEPKGGKFFDAGHKLNCDDAWKALKLVDSGKMPEGGPPLTPQEKGLFLKELYSLVENPQPETPQ